MTIRIHHPILLAAVLTTLAGAASAPRASVLESDTLAWRGNAPESTDTLRFDPPVAEPWSRRWRARHGGEDAWLQAPFGENLLADLDRRRDHVRSRRPDDMIVDYNRVDQLRLGVREELGTPLGSGPRVGGRFEYAFGRKRSLYGVQVEQPLVPSGRFAVGVSFARRTDHSDLQQIDDLENSLALLLGRQDYRDYFEREGAGVYLMWRVPDFSTVSVHLREDTWRSLKENRSTQSWFHTDRPLRANPAIDDGDTRAVTVRLERLLHRSARTRAGLYHWLELERAGAGFGGDFDYVRALADLRSVVRLSPATTLAARALAGSAVDGTLPRQKEFTLGGVDGLRGHAFDQYRGDQIALAQIEYSVGLWRLSGPFEGGLEALVFLDTGRAWTNPGRSWDPARQHMQADAGFGFGTSEDNVRVYLARNLQKPGSDYLVSLRLRRPF